MHHLIDQFILKSSAGYVQFFRYAFLSGIALLVDVGFLYLLYIVFGIHYRIAATISFLLGMAVVYVGSIGWVFDRRSLKNTHTEAFIFFVIGILGLSINVVLISLGVEFLHLPVFYAKAMSVIFVFSFNFIARKYLLFR